MILLSSCKEDIDTNSILKEFNNFLGKEKAEALNKAVASYDNFIQVNFGEAGSIMFLKHLCPEFYLDPDWIFETEMNLLILDELENSGLRKEISIRLGENYKPKYQFEPILPKNVEPQSTIEDFDIELPTEFESSQRIKDSSFLYMNTEGVFMYRLAKFSNDSLVIGYVKALCESGDLSPSLIACGLADLAPSDLKNPFIKRIIVAHIYLELVRWDVEKR